MYKWIKEGDKNTKYFHTLALIRKRKNTISTLFSNGVCVSDPAGIHKEAISYFKTLFKEEYPSRPVIEDLNFNKINPEQASFLVSPFSRTEIEEAVESCNAQKAPGPDGFNFRFIKESWEVIKEDVFKIFDEFWASGKLPKGSNVAFIALIAKIETPMGLKDYRPISMVGCIYKMISKLLARRLQSVMHSVIGPHQSSFIAGRQILDGALIAGEIIDSHKKNKIKSTILKLDFHKAFDSVAWSFLEWTLIQMNFPVTWRSWILSCVKSAAASILINGSPSSTFKLHRGLRQGDPLSPFLFNLIVETLSLLIQKGAAQNLWEGVEASKGGPKITHLQYADDIVIFCPPRLEYLLNLKKALILFQVISGLQINFHKSSLLGINTDESWLQQAARALLCKVGELPIIYLGLPIGGNMSRIDAWKPIIKKIEKRLASWKGRMLSIAGRLTLIKASISSLPLYYMSLFPAPKGVVEKINGLQRRFLWSGSSGKKALALTSWSSLEVPKALGGLSCGSILHRNLALLFKWAWRLVNETNSFWRNVVSEKYGYGPNFQLHDLCAPKRGGPWKEICSHILKHPELSRWVKTHFMRRLGDGKSALFWHDFWIGSGPLKYTFRRLFAIAASPNASIAESGHWAEDLWNWDLGWTRPLRARDEAEWANLKIMLSSVCPSIEIADSFIWLPSKEGSFSVKSITMELAKSFSLLKSTVSNLKKIWSGVVPPRIEVFTWLAILGKINSKEKLMRLNIIPPDEAECVLCNSQIENPDHLLLQCPFSWAIWNWWLSIWGLSWVFPRCLRDAFDQWKSIKRNPFSRKVWNAIFSIIIWSIWKERNARIFKKLRCDLKEVQDLILTRLCWWIDGWGDPFPYSISDVIRNPSCLEWNHGGKASDRAPISDPSVGWSPPNPMSLKWNVDASVNILMDTAAIGGVLRDHKGIFKCVFSSPTPPIEINSAEVLAIFRAMQISLSCGILQTGQLIIESDSANAVKWSNEDSGGPWALNFQLNFIRNARKKWPDISIIHKCRGSNMVADALAKKGLVRRNEFLAWL